MQPKLRPVTALVLIGFLIYNSLGYLLVIPAVKVLHRHHFQASLPSLQEFGPVTFTFENGTEKGHLKNGSRELSIGGKMYDIIEKKVEGNTTIYICYRDTKEEKINAMASGKGMQTENAPLPGNHRLVFEQIIKIAVVRSSGFKLPDFSGKNIPVNFSCYYSDPLIQVPDHPPCSIL